MVQMAAAVNARSRFSVPLARIAEFAESTAILDLIPTPFLVGPVFESTLPHSSTQPPCRCDLSWPLGDEGETTRLVRGLRK